MMAAASAATSARAHDDADVPPDQKIWTKRFQRYSQFKENSVTNSFPSEGGGADETEKKLARWAKSQRQFRRKGEPKYALGEYRVTMLDSIGFDWGVGNVPWNDRLVQVEDYKINNSDEVVDGQVYIKHSRLGLGRWADYQRECYNNEVKKNGKQYLTAEKKSDLIRVGFRFETLPRRTAAPSGRSGDGEAVPVAAARDTDTAVPPLPGDGDSSSRTPPNDFEAVPAAVAVASARAGRGGGAATATALAETTADGQGPGEDVPSVPTPAAAAEEEAEDGDIGNFLMDPDDGNHHNMRMPPLPAAATLEEGGAGTSASMILASSSAPADHRPNSHAPTAIDAQLSNPDDFRELVSNAPNGANINVVIINNSGIGTVNMGTINNINNNNVTNNHYNNVTNNHYNYDNSININGSNHNINMPITYDNRVHNTTVNVPQPVVCAHHNGIVAPSAAAASNGMSDQLDNLRIGED